MKPWIIVGGGFSGLVVARCLKQRGISIVGIERGERLGGSLSSGLARVHEKGSLEVAHQFIDDIEWDWVEEAPAQRSKGNWSAVAENDDESLAEHLRAGHYVPRHGYQAIVDKLVESVRDQFHLRTLVTEIDPEKRLLSTSDGQQFEYERLIWCAPIEALPKLWQGDKTPILRVSKRLKDGDGGICWKLALREPLFPNRNTVIFPFRYKDKKLKALGWVGAPSETEANTHQLLWVLSLDDEIMADREEIAKSVRTLKRELIKEFPELPDRLISERIIFLPKVSDEVPAPVETLELAPHLIYVGPQVRLKSAKEDLRGLDVTLDNCLNFEGFIKAVSPDESAAPPAEPA